MFDTLSPFCYRKNGENLTLKRVYEEGREVELHLLYHEEQIAAEVQRLADEISSDYAGEELALIVVLKGAFMFASDLARRLKVPSTIDFVRLKSYRGTATTGEVSLISDADVPVAGRNVLLVEDIVDTGLSLAFLLEYYRSRGPKSLKACALLDKSENRRVEIAPDYTGMACKNAFVVGYGLDLDERWRELPAIYEVTNPLMEV